MMKSVSSWGYDLPQLQDQSEIPVTVCLACVWQIWPHECIEWLSRSKKSSAYNEASPWSCNMVAPSSPPGEMPFFCMPRSLLVPCHLLPKYKWGEGPMLNINDPLLICPPLLILVPPVHSCHGGFAVAWCKRVEHPCIKKCTLLLILPEVLGADICPSIIFCVCSLVLQLLTSEWLKDWLYGDTGTDLCKDVCCDVPDVVVPHRRKPTTVATESMLYAKLLPTGAVGRQVWQWPSIP